MPTSKRGICRLLHKNVHLLFELAQYGAWWLIMRDLQYGRSGRA
ncbi:MAG: hypothetical protein OXI67_09775 [Candidatus Poribacteria bacterium]|nr:hypothetical protein [Candidatus Poribacteria bacterium]MDE0482855.1 hypothetical protein [Candidatus Poribacteria bacterium]